METHKAPPHGLDRERLNRQQPQFYTAILLMLIFQVTHFKKKDDFFCSIAAVHCPNQRLPFTIR